MHAREENDSVNGLQVETTYPTNLGCMLTRKSKMLTSTAVQKHRRTGTNYCSVNHFAELNTSFASSLVC